MLGLPSHQGPEVSEGDPGVSKRQMLLGSLPKEARDVYLQEQPVPKFHPRQSGSNAMALGAPNRLKRRATSQLRSESPTRRRLSPSMGTPWSPTSDRRIMEVRDRGPGFGRLTPPQAAFQSSSAVVIKREPSEEGELTSMAAAADPMEGLSGTMGTFERSIEASPASAMGMDSLKAALSGFGSSPPRLAAPQSISHTAGLGNGATMTPGAPFRSKEAITPYQTEKTIKTEPDDAHPAIERLFQNRPNPYVHVQKRDTADSLLQREALASMKEALKRRMSSADSMQGVEQPDAQADVPKTVEK